MNNQNLVPRNIKIRQNPCIKLTLPKQIEKIEGFLRTNHEKNISTLRNTPQKNPRLPCQNENERRPLRAKCSSLKGTQALSCLRALKSSRIAELLKTRPATNGCWALYSGASVNQQRPELGLAIAKRLAKRAVDRNKLKRLSRELIKSPAFGSKSDCVIKLRKAIGKNTHGKLRKHEQNTLRERLMELANAAD